LLNGIKSSADLTVKACLEGRPIVHLIKYGGQLELTKRVDLELTLCLELLQVSLSSQAVKILVGDMIKKYDHESLEDILCCLKDGRNGKFGEIYGKFNMIVFTKWMKEHLTEVSLLRESLLEVEKGNHNWETREEYLQAVEIGNINQKEIKKKEDLNSRKENDYQLFKGKYLLKKQSEAEKLEEVTVKK